MSRRIAYGQLEGWMMPIWMSSNFSELSELTLLEVSQDPTCRTTSLLDIFRITRHLSMHHVQTDSPRAVRGVDDAYLDNKSIKTKAIAFHLTVLVKEPKIQRKKKVDIHKQRPWMSQSQ